MNKHKRIEKTQKAVQHCVDKAEVRLQATLHLCHEKQASIENLENYQQQYQQTLLQKGASGLSAWQLQQMDGFIHHLSHAVVVEKHQLNNLQHQADAKRHELCQQQVKKAAVDNLSKRYQQQADQQNAQREQTELDDLASNNHSS